MDTDSPLAAVLPAPTGARPLLGLTVLVVEDSRFACEAMRLLCLRSGARIRRADCLRSARRHLQVYRPSVLIVDLGLPDGNGLDLITELSTLQPRVEVILAMSADTHLETEAMAVGADGFLAKPLTSVAEFQQYILTRLPPDRQPTGPRALDRSEVVPDRIALQDDMAHIADLLEAPLNDSALDYVAQFLRGVAQSADDPQLVDAARALAKKRAKGEPSGSETAMIAGMIQHRMTQRIAI